jgi:hypothetical protein
MSKLLGNGVLIFGLLVSVALSADAQVRTRHHLRRQLIGPSVGVVVAPTPPPVEFGPSGGNDFTIDNGHFNSMGNDFGTSGVLGHTNGMPASSYIYH